MSTFTGLPPPPNPRSSFGPTADWLLDDGIWVALMHSISAAHEMSSRCYFCDCSFLSLVLRVWQNDPRSWAPRLIWNPTWKAPSQTHPFGLWQNETYTFPVVREHFVTAARMSCPDYSNTAVGKKTQGRRDGFALTVWVAEQSLKILPCSPNYTALKRM